MDSKKRASGQALKFTPERRATILRLIASGAPREIAARSAGICKQTFYNWLEAEPEFAEDVEQADAAAECEAVTKVQWAGRHDWKALAWWLERTRPERYRQRTDTNLGGQQGNPLEIAEVRRVIVQKP